MSLPEWPPTTYSPEEAEKIEAMVKLWGPGAAQQFEPNIKPTPYETLLREGQEAIYALVLQCLALGDPVAAKLAVVDKATSYPPYTIEPPVLVPHPAPDPDEGVFYVD